MSVARFLGQPAVKITVVGTYSLSNWYDSRGRPRTFACQTTRVSPFQLMVNVPVVGRIGNPTTCYFHDLGKLDGVISDTTNGSFLLDLEMTGPMREKFASKLAWLEKRQKDPRVEEARKDARIIPIDPHSTLTFADGTIRPCFVIDMSASGAAVSAAVQPPIGTPLAVGACVGRVVRGLPEGFAVKFAEAQNGKNFERLLGRFRTSCAK